LGSGFILSEGDKIEDRAIIFCNTNKSCCNGGTYVIPSSGEQYYSYVDYVNHNNDWIFVSTIQIKDHSKKYWIISKKKIKNIKPTQENIDDIIGKSIMGPMKYEDWQKKIRLMNIKLSDVSDW